MSTTERQKNLAINGTFDLPLDVHLHTLLSPDSVVPVDVYPALAIALGMPRIAITDHLDFDPREPCVCESVLPMRNAKMNDHQPKVVRERVRDEKPVAR